MSHFIESCKKCRDVISQCRCPDASKDQRWSICGKCSQQGVEVPLKEYEDRIKAMTHDPKLLAEEISKRIETGSPYSITNRARMNIWIEEAIRSYALPALEGFESLINDLKEQKCYLGYYPTCIDAKKEHEKLAPVIFSHINPCGRCLALTKAKSTIEGYSQ